MPSTANVRRYYYLPIHLAFLNSRWLGFWDILYYIAYQQPQVLSNLESSSYHLAENLAVFNLTSSRFTQLFYGLPAEAAPTAKERETGRKKLNQLATLAEQANLLTRIEETPAGDLIPEYGSKAERCFGLPLYHQPNSIPLIAKPNTFVEQGWLSTLSHGTYEQHLLNLYLLKPDLSTSSKFLVSELEAAYALAQSFLANSPDIRVNQPSASTLQRELQKALGNLQARGLFTPEKGFVPARLWCKSSAKSVNSKPLISETHKARLPRSENYYQYDSFRADFLQRLWDTGLLQEREIRSVWECLPDFYGQSDFDILLHSLKQREIAAQQQRDISWKEIVATAKAKCSQRGTRSYLSPAKPSKTARKLELTFANLNFDKEDVAYCHKKLSLAQFLADPKNLFRANLKTTVNVPTWRYFQALPSQEQPLPLEVKLRLLDEQYNLLFAGAPHFITAAKAEVSWSESLDIKHFREWLTALALAAASDAPVVLHLEAELLPNSAVSSARPLTTNWFNLSVKFSLSR